MPAADVRPLLFPESRVLSPEFMILEVAILNVISGREAEFEEAFRRAQRIILSLSGYRSHELRRGVEAANRYILLVNLGYAGRA